MAIQKISFGNLENKQQVVSKQNLSVSKPEVVDKQKSNASKYMIGATVLAGVTALCIAGYKGKLGKNIKKMPNDLKEGVSKIEKYTADELNQIGSKDLFDVTPEEFEKVFNTIIPEDEPMLKAGLNKLMNFTRDIIEKDDITINDLIERVGAMRRYLCIKLGRDKMKKLLGEDSILNKEINKVKVGDLVDVLPKKLQDSFMKKSSGLIFEDVKERLVVDIVKEMEEKFPSDIDLNKSAIENFETIISYL